LPGKSKKIEAAWVTKFGNVNQLVEPWCGIHFWVTKVEVQSHTVTKSASVNSGRALISSLCLWMHSYV